MKIDFEGRTWQLDLEEIDMRQGDKIAAYTGLSLVAWLKSLTDTDSLAWGKSIRCLYWLLRDQNDEPITLERANFAPLKLLLAFNEASETERPAEAEPDPTKPGVPSAATEPTAAATGRAG